MHTAAEIEIGTRKEATICRAKHAELEDRDAHGLDVTLQFDFRPSSGSTCRNRESEWRKKPHHTLIGPGKYCMVLTLRVVVVVSRIIDLITLSSVGIKVPDALYLRNVRRPRKVVNLRPGGRRVNRKQSAQIRRKLLHSRFGAIEGILYTGIHPA